LSVFTQRVTCSFFKKIFTSWTLSKRSIVGLKKALRRDQKKLLPRDFTDERANNRKKRYGLSLSPKEREKTIVDNKYKRHQQHAQSLYSFSNGYASFSSVWFFEKVVFDSPLLPLVAVGFFGVWMARTTTLADDFFALRRLFFPRWFNLFPPEKQIASVAENGIA